MKKIFLGVDVSKESLQLCVKDETLNTLKNTSVRNDEDTIRTVLKNLLKERNIDKQQLYVCAEYTGRYSNILALACFEEGISIWLEDPTKIKQAMWDRRGKTDKVDAAKIAEYQVRFFDRRSEYKPKDINIQKIAILERTRRDLLKVINMTEPNMAEDRRFLPKEVCAIREGLMNPVLNSLKEALAKVEDEIAEVIKSDVTLSTIDRHIQSIPGVGKVISHSMIVLTEGFTKFPTARAFNNYCGTIPHEYESGTSVHKKPRTSNRCSQQMKRVLYLPMIAHVKSSKRDPEETELHEYYQRKKDEGKPHNVIVNSMMAKTIRMIFTLVREDRDYIPEKEYIATRHPERKSEKELHKAAS